MKPRSGIEVSVKRVGVFVGIVATSLCAAASGCEYVTNLGYYGEQEGGPPDDARGDACTSACGSRCCTSGAACIDGSGKGVCANDVVETSAGGEGACAVFADGSLWCWGGNQYGEVGAGPEGDELCEVGAPPKKGVACRSKPVRVMGDVAHVSAGFQYACAIKRDSSVWCWGRNNADGILGHAPGTAGDGACKETLDAGEPSQPCNPVPQRVPDLSAVEIRAGNYHTCALTADGSVFCWGSNETKGLAYPGPGGPIPRRIDNLPKIAHVDLGLFAYHTCAVAAEGGSVYCWGANDWGELGHPPELDKDCDGHCTITPIPVSTKADEEDAAAYEPFTDAVDVRLGYLYTCALRKNGTVWCWGGNDFGTIGVGSPEPRIHRAPVQVEGLPVVRALDVGFAHVCGWTEQGQLWCWGDNVLGALGLENLDGDICPSSTKCRRTPRAGIKNVLNFSLGGAMTLAVSEDQQTLWAWGINDTARLGHTPLRRNDLDKCGDHRHSVCNPVPLPVEWPRGTAVANAPR